MGNKRKRSDDQQHNKESPSSSTTPFDMMPCSSMMELFSKESHPVDSRELNSLSSVMGFMDSPADMFNVHRTFAYHHHGLSRALLSKRSRHHYGHQYSRRNFISHPPASTSQGKIMPLNDGESPFKLASQYYTDTIVHSENQEKSYSRPERIESNSLVMDTVSHDMMKMTCGTCRRPLRQRPSTHGNTVSASEPSVVSVLVCGHVYHADCLEQRTRAEDKWDPPCPLCIDLLSD